MMNWVTVRRIGLIGLALLVCACSKPDPIRIGFIADLSGRNADLGVAGRNGVILALEQINAVGGIRGATVELMGADLQQDADTARKVTQEMLAKKIEVIIGPMTSAAAMNILPLVEKSGTILLSPTVTTTLLTGKDDHFLRVVADTRSYASASARYQIDTMGHRRISVIYDVGNKAYSESWLADFVRVFESAGGKLLSKQTFTSGGDASFLQLARAALQDKPEAVLIIGSAVDAALLVQQVRKFDSQVHLLLPEWPMTERFIELAGSAGEGVIAAQFIDRNDQSPRYLAFRKAYMDRFSMEPGFAGLTGYDAAQVVLEAYTKRQSGISIKQTITDIGRFQGVQGVFQIDRMGDTQRDNYITMVQGGQFKQVKRISLPIAPLSVK